MTDLADFTGLVARDHGLAVVSTPGSGSSGPQSCTGPSAAAHCHPARSVTVTRGVARR